MKKKNFLLLIFVFVIVILPFTVFAGEETLVFRNEEGYILLTGEHVARAVAQVTPNHAGVPETVVSIEFTEEGTRLFGDVTRNNIGRMIHIYVNGELVSSPIVQAIITDGTAIISGNFTTETATQLARTLSGQDEPNRQENAVNRLANRLRNIFRRT